MHKTTMNKRNGFTLIELLVVIAIIAILAAILFPVFGRARASARQQACNSNVKQLALAVIMYANDWKGRFPTFKWNEQWKQLEDSNIVKYVKSEEMFRCPGADGDNSARVPPTGASDSWKNNFGKSFGDPVRWRFTDYKMMDNQWLPSMPTDQVRSPAWLVTVIDNTDWIPRHPRGTGADKNNGGNNIGFLDGHSKHFYKKNYNDGVKGSGQDVDDNGASPFWNWGLDKAYWIPG